MVTSLIQPSYHQGFYSPQRGGISLRPNLWKGLVGCWKPSLGVTGLTLRDVSGFGNHGTLTNMALDDWVISGNPKVPGYALDLDGSDDTVNMDGTGSLDITDVITFTAWVYLRTNNATWDLIVTKWNDSGTDTDKFVYHFSVHSGKLSLFVSTTGSDTGTEILDTETLALNQWNEVGFIINTATDEKLIYKNGVQVASGSYTTASIPSTTQDVVFGGKVNISIALIWDGLIADIRIYNRALSASEFLDMYLFPNAMFRTRRIIGRAPVVTGVDVRKHIIQAYMRMCA